MGSSVATLSDPHTRDGTGWPAGLELTAFAFCVGQAVFLATAYVSGVWLFDAQGARLANDFTGFYAAWQFLLDGHAVQLWDPAAHKAAANAVIGYNFSGSYPPSYTAHYMMASAVFGLLPYMVSFAVWVPVISLPYLFVASKIIDHRGALILACAFPSLLANVYVGQNGCLTAAFIGGALLAMQAGRPILAGCLIACLTYKPHFGILVPLALIASRQWRVFVSAAAWVVGIVLLTWLVLGTDAWVASFNALLSTNQNTLVDGLHDWHKQQNPFGLVRVLGGNVELAWLAQGAVTLAMAGWVWFAWAPTWASRQPFAMKAAILSIGAFVASPYSYMYDTMILAIPVAFVLRDGLDRGFLRGEMMGLLGACLLLATFPLVKMPVGVGAAFILVVLIARRFAALAPRDPDVATARSAAAA